MPYSDIMDAKSVWDKTIELINSGDIVNRISDKGVRYTNFPKQKDSRVSHVRPHANNADDTYPLPVKDKVTGLNDYTKHCFWINASYISNDIYLKD